MTVGAGFGRHAGARRVGGRRAKVGAVALSAKQRAPHSRRRRRRSRSAARATTRNWRSLAPQPAAHRRSDARGEHDGSVKSTHRMRRFSAAPRSPSDAAAAACTHLGRGKVRTNAASLSAYPTARRRRHATRSSDSRSQPMRVVWNPDTRRHRRRRPQGAARRRRRAVRPGQPLAALQRMRRAEDGRRPRANARPMSVALRERNFGAKVAHLPLPAVVATQQYVTERSTTGSGLRIVSDTCL